MSLAPSEPAPPARRDLRERMHRIRDAFVAESDAAAQAALAAHLRGVLNELQPERLGLYWPLRSEFNAAAACLADPGLQSLDLALPYAKRSPHDLHYRAWDRSTPTGRDECGIPTAEGPEVMPDVVLVPCLAFTASGYRLGYGGGYYDRWLAAHPQVTAVGVAWSVTELSEAELGPQAHDHPLTVVVTDQGIAGG